MVELIGKGGIMIPLWAACLVFFGTIFVALITGWFMLKGKRMDAPQQALTSLLVNAPALLTKAQELLTANAVLQDRLREREGQIDDLGEQIAGLGEKITALSDTVRTLTAQADRIPGLEAENAGLRAQNTSKDREIDRLNAECNAALRAMERAQGGLTTARQTIIDICPQIDCPPFQAIDCPPFSAALPEPAKEAHPDAPTRSDSPAAE